MAETQGFSLEYTCLWLPVAVGEQLYHSLLRRAGCNTFAPTAPASDQAAALQAATLPESFSRPDVVLEAALDRFGLL